jgi:hypothetical protein
LGKLPSGGTPETADLEGLAVARGLLSSSGMRTFMLFAALLLTGACSAPGADANTTTGALGDQDPRTLTILFYTLAYGDDTAISGISVQVSGADINQSLTTDELGNISFPVHLGDYIITSPVDTYADSVEFPSGDHSFGQTHTLSIWRNDDCTDRPMRTDGGCDNHSGMINHSFFTNDEPPNSTPPMDDPNNPDPPDPNDPCANPPAGLSAMCSDDSLGIDYYDGNGEFVRSCPCADQQVCVQSQDWTVSCGAY